MATMIDLAKAARGRSAARTRVSRVTAASVRYGTALTSCEAGGAVDVMLDGSAEPVTLHAESPIASGERVRVVSQGGSYAVVALSSLVERVADAGAQATEAKDAAESAKEQAKKAMEQSAEDLKAAKEAAQAAKDTAEQTGQLAVTGTSVEYAAGASPTVAPTSGWSAAPPSYDGASYVWQRVRVTHGSGDSEVTEPVLVTGNAGPRGERGVEGAPGKDGKDGTGVAILGSYGTMAELEAAHPAGSAGDGYLVGGDLYVWGGAAWKNVGRIQGPQGAQGDSVALVTTFWRLSTTAPDTPSGPADPEGWSKTVPEVPDRYTGKLYRCTRTTLASGMALWAAPSVDSSYEYAYRAWSTADGALAESKAVSDKVDGFARDYRQSWEDVAGGKYATASALKQTNDLLATEVTARSEAVDGAKSYADTQVKQSATEIKSEVASGYLAKDGKYTSVQSILDQTNSSITATFKETVTATAVEYALSPSPTVAPETGWSTTAPEWQRGMYVWQRTTVTKGEKGDPGDNFGGADRLAAIETMIRQSADGVEVSRMVNGEHTGTRALLAPDEMAFQSADGSATLASLGLDKLVLGAASTDTRIWLAKPREPPSVADAEGFAEIYTDGQSLFFLADGAIMMLPSLAGSDACGLSLDGTRTAFVGPIMAAGRAYLGKDQVRSLGDGVKCYKHMGFCALQLTNFAPTVALSWGALQVGKPLPTGWRPTETAKAPLFAHQGSVAQVSVGTDGAVKVYGEDIEAGTPLSGSLVWLAMT